MAEAKHRRKTVRSSPKAIQFLQRHTRKIVFGCVGVFVTLVGYAVMFIAVDIWHWNTSVAYVVQTVISIELNFVLNYWFTFGDRRAPGAWRRFHSVRLVITIPLNQALFNGLVWAGVHYLFANALCIVATTIVNYVLSDRFVFRSKTADKETTTGTETAPDNKETPMSPTADCAPPFSVVLPTKNVQDGVNEDVRIVKTVEALLAQQYPHRLEIIVVGDIGDGAWRHLERFGPLIKRYAAQISSPGRDSNMKRSIGLRHASIGSNILAAMDDDVIPSPTWALEVASRLQGNIHAVAGPVSGLGDSFWTRYIDRNPAASKMPRISAGYVLNRQTLKRRKPPVTANFAITRELYEAVGGPDPAFTNSYEDYSWMSVMVQGGYNILCDKALACERYHREGLRPLIREYKRSGKGCGDLVNTRYGQCVFAQKRVRQLLTFYGLMLAMFVLLVAAPVYTVLGGLGASIALASAVAIKVRRLEAMSYPFISLLLGSMFIIGFTGRLLANKELIKPTLHKLHFVQPDSPTIATAIPTPRFA